MCLAFLFRVSLCCCNSYILVDVEGAGLRRSNLISWYLGEVESEIESEAELLDKKTVIEKVLDRLVHHVSESV